MNENYIFGELIIYLTYYLLYLLSNILSYIMLYLSINYITPKFIFHLKQLFCSGSIYAKPVSALRTILARSSYSMLKNVAWRTARGGGACAGRGQSGAVLVCRGPGLLRVPFNCDNFDYGGTLTHSHAPTAAPRKTLNTHALHTWRDSRRGIM